MRYLNFFFFLLAINHATAQECTAEWVQGKPGNWKVGLKGSEIGSPAELAKEKAIIARLHKMILAKYTPVGVECIFHGAFEAVDDGRSNSFNYSLFPMNYYCDNNQVKTAHETSAYFSIAANSFFSYIYDLPEIESASGAGFHFIPNMPVEKDGYWVFPEADVTLGFGIKGRAQSWLVTYPGKLPFAYVTKKEFLEKRIRILEREKQLANEGFRDVLKRIEMEKGFKEKEYKNDPQKMAHYLRMDYQSTKERYEKLVKDQDRNFQPAFDKLEAQMKLPVAELSAPAIVKMDPEDHLSYLFTEDSDPFGKVLIKPHAAYFNAKLTRSSPQFFWILMRGNPKDPQFKGFYKGVTNALDFSLMKTLVGK
jgi:hypothetical protein